MPDVVKIDTMEEPWIKATIYTPTNIWVDPQAVSGRRGIQTGLTYVGGRAQVNYELPLNEVVFDFYDRLKSISRGYASFDYEQIGLREATS
jgi:GTP-binding protein LepA